MKSFPTNSIVFVVNFVKNYTFQVQNEVQSMHWNSYHITILVHISYRLNPDYDPYDENSRVSRLNTIFMCQIIESMIMNLCNIVSNYIGSVFQTRDWSPHRITYGQMGVQVIKTLVFCI